MESSDLWETSGVRVFDNRAVVLHRAQQPGGPRTCAFSDAKKRRDTLEPHQRGSSIPGKAGEEAQIVELPAAPSDTASNDERAWLESPSLI